jgi:hypothetical protein
MKPTSKKYFSSNEMKKWVPDSQNLNTLSEENKIVVKQFRPGINVKKKYLFPDVTTLNYFRPIIHNTK